MSNDEVTRAFMKLQCSACGWQNIGRDPHNHRAFHIAWEEDNKIQRVTCVSCYYDNLDPGEAYTDDVSPEFKKSFEKVIEQDDEILKRLKDHDEFTDQEAADLAESLDQMRRGEGREIQPEELE